MAKKTFRLLLLSFSLVLTLLSCQSTNIKDVDSYFEGTIKYQTSKRYLNVDTSFYTDELLTANLMEFSVKDGDYRKDFYRNNQPLLSIFFDRKNNLSYIENKDSDTVLYYSTLGEDLLLDSIYFLGQDSILGFLTNHVILDCYGNSETIYKNERLHFEYWISTDEGHASNSNWYEGCKECGYDELMEKYPHLILKMSVSNGSSIQKFEAVEIIREKVPRIVFPRNKVLKLI